MGPPTIFLKSRIRETEVFSSVFSIAHGGKSDPADDVYIQKHNAKLRLDFRLAVKGKGLNFKAIFVQVGILDGPLQLIFISEFPIYYSCQSQKPDSKEV